MEMRPGSTSPTSSTPASAGCDVGAAMIDRLVLWMIRAMFGTADAARGKTRIATRWEVCSSSARNTVPKAPAPSARTIR